MAKNASPGARSGGRLYQRGPKAPRLGLGPSMRAPRRRAGGEGGAAAGCASVRTTGRRGAGGGGARGRGRGRGAVGGGGVCRVAAAGVGVAGGRATTRAGAVRRRVPARRVPGRPLG